MIGLKSNDTFRLKLYKNAYNELLYILYRDKIPFLLSFYVHKIQRMRIIIII